MKTFFLARLHYSPSEDGGKLYIIKTGGNIIDDEKKLSQFLQSFSSIQSPKILVHGGGKLATRLAEQLGIEQQMVEGRRITNAETLKIVTMVYAGYINKNIVALLQANGCNAIGLCGADGNLVQSHKRLPKASSFETAKPSVGQLKNIDGEIKNFGGVDFGFAGDIDAINANLLQSLLSQNMSVVVAPITHNKEGQLLNTNADTIAQEIAQVMSVFYEVHLIYCFERSGVLLDANDDSTVIPSLNYQYYQELKTPPMETGDSPKIFAGMIPKVDNAFAAVSKGVHRVVIGKAEQLEQLIAQTAGTSIIHE